MPKVLEIEDVDRVKAEIQDYFSVNEDARFVRRLDVILLICNDHPINYAAGLFEMNPTTVQRWIHRLNTLGFEGLKDKPGRGRRPRLEETDRLELQADLKRSPKDFDYQQARWDGKLLSHHLKLHYGVELKVRQCQKLFKQLGFSLRRPRRMPTGADSEKREEFKKNSKRYLA